MSSLIEVDISQNSDSTSYFSFPEIDDSLQHSCTSLCDQEISWEFKSNPSSYYLSLESVSQEEDALAQSEVSLLQQQFLQRQNVFYEECHHPVTNPVSNGLKKYFSPPIS